jgi:hypothetical protein
MSRFAAQFHIADQEGVMGASTTAMAVALSLVLVSQISANAQAGGSASPRLSLPSIDEMITKSRKASMRPDVMRRGAMHESRWLAAQTPAPRRRSWISRHPVFFGTLVGFGAGFLIGYLPGDDGVFDDFTAGFNGWVMGGIGAGTGAIVGAATTPD